jgi:ribosomal protein L3
MAATCKGWVDVRIVGKGRTAQGFDGLHHGFGGRARQAGADVVHHDAGAVARELQRVRPAQPAAGAGDDGHFVLQQFCHFTSLSML